MKVDEIVNVGLSAAYEEGTLVAQATLSLAIRYAKKRVFNSEKRGHSNKKKHLVIFNTLDNRRMY